MKQTDKTDALVSSDTSDTEQAQQWSDSTDPPPSTEAGLTGSTGIR
jgi:hypothetical protein